MANTFTNAYSEFFKQGVQDNSDKMLVSYGTSTVTTKNERVLHNRYNSTPVGSDGAAQLSYSVSDFTSTDDSLEVNRRATVAEHVDSIEQLQTNYDLIAERAERASYVVRDKIDQYVMNLPVAFSGVANLDAGTFGGGTSNGVAFQITNTNADEVADDIIEAIDLNDGAIDKGRYWVVSPTILKRVANYMKNNGFGGSDEVIQNGFMTIQKNMNGFTGRDFGGLMVFQSNNLTHEVSLGLATNPTDGDTIVLEVPGNGGARKTITVTFEATLSGSAGGVHIASTVDITRANLAEFLNAYGRNSEAEATDTGYTALATGDADALERAQISTTNDDTANTLAITTKSSLKVSETLTDGTDAFGNLGVHTIAGVMGAVDMALPADGMEYVEKGVAGKHGWEVVTSRVYQATIWELKKGQVFDTYLYV